MENKKEEPIKGYRCPTSEAVQISQALDDVTFVTLDLEQLTKFMDLSKELESIAEDYAKLEKRIVKLIKPNEPVTKYKKEFKILRGAQERKVVITKAFDLTEKVVLQNVPNMKKRLVSLILKVLCYKDEPDKSN